MMKKKGSINLSINMIIVLIIGIVILGLALGFVRGVFGGLTTDIEELAGNEPKPEQPTTSEPVTLSTDQKVLNSKDAGVIKIRVFNPTGGIANNVKPSLGCVNTAFAHDDEVNSKSIEVSGDEEFIFLIKVDNQAPGTYLCQFTIGVNSETFTKDMFIEIKG